jgi:galactoside O-acetyltransferase
VAFLSRNEIEKIGFLSLGQNVLISDKCSIYNPANIKIGNNVRIDDFCILSAGVGGIELGSYIHISAYASLIGAGKIKIGDFSALSVRSSVFSSSDDFSGEMMANPIVPKQYRMVDERDVFIERHVLIGAGVVILPGVKIHLGAAVGALSLVNKDLNGLSVYHGNPVRFLHKRKCDFLKYEKLINP